MKWRRPPAGRDHRPQTPPAMACAGRKTAGPAAPAPAGKTGTPAGHASGRPGKPGHRLGPLGPGARAPAGGSLGGVQGRTTAVLCRPAERPALALSHPTHRDIVSPMDMEPTPIKHDYSLVVCVRRVHDGVRYCGSWRPSRRRVARDVFALAACTCRVTGVQATAMLRTASPTITSLLLFNRQRTEGRPSIPATGPVGRTSRSCVGQYHLR